MATHSLQPETASQWGTEIFGQAHALKPRSTRDAHAVRLGPHLVERASRTRGSAHVLMYTRHDTTGEIALRA